jgi:phage terminase large subunit-like protein
LTPEKKREILRAVQIKEKRQARAGLIKRGIHWNDHIPHVPGPKQIEFLALDQLEAYFGGAAGGGKSDALLMAALQYVDKPGYAALLLRRTYKDLSLPGALMDRAGSWLRGTAAKWTAETKTWRFPSGATLTFGHLDNEADKYNYQSSEFQFVGFDEVTQFTKSQYEYLFSRLRRLAGAEIPIRMRSASNPDGEYMEWVQERFIPDEYVNSLDDSKFDKVWGKGGTTFVPSRLEDNAFIDQDEYDTSLHKLGVVMYARLRSGDWAAVLVGDEIKSEWFENQYFPFLPEGARWKVRAWDLALKDKQVIPDGKKKTNPDYHATVCATVYDDCLWLGRPSIWRGQWSDAVTKMMLVMQDERTITHGTGEALHETAAVQSLLNKGLSLTQYKEHGADNGKVARARAWINQASIGRVKLVGTRDEWKDFTYWWWRFPTGAHDDSVDAVSGVAAMLGLVFQKNPPAPKPKSAYGFVDSM